MRLAFALIAAIAALDGAASAQTIQPISFSPAFEEKLHDELGPREGDYLREMVSERVNAALAQRGIDGDTARIDISIIDARPNRPTLAQAGALPGLDMMRSISTGGAELRAVLRDANGEAVSEIEHRYYSGSLDDLAYYTPTTWSDARRSISRFAEKVADAYASLR